jgi:hypothetical protein
VLDLLAYHRDADVAHAVLAAKVVAGVVLTALAGGLVLWLPGHEGGRNLAARAALVVAGAGLFAYGVFKVLPDGASATAYGVTWIAFVLAGLAGPAFGVAGAFGARRDGERRLAVVGLLGSLLLPAIFAANVTACALTDGCFH